MRCGLALLLALMAVTPVGAPVVAGPLAFVETVVQGPEGQDASRPAWPVVARLSGPTDRYDHDVLGHIPPWSVLEVQALACGACRHGFEGASVVLPDHLVFEDVAPRLWDVTGDGRPEIVVVESDVMRGARLVVWTYSNTGADLTRLAASAFIGTRHRWLAPVGAGDFDGDGRVELAYVDRPHLAKELVFVRLEGDRLQEIARVPGFSGHRIGDSVITSAMRSCDRVEVLLPDGDWARLRAVRLDGGQVIQRDMGAMSDRALARAQGC